MRLAALLILLLLLALAAPAQAQRQPLGNAVVTVAMGAEGIEASVQLDRAVTRFAFASADVVRQGEFELLTPGLTLEGDSLVSARPFRAFALRVRPAREERDAKYPAHFRIGTGGVVYAPALMPSQAAWRTRLVVRTGPGQVQAPRSGDVSRGFVFIGPAELLKERDGISLVADPQTPAWLVERASTGLASATRFFTEALGQPLPRAPLLIVSHRPGGSRDFNVGDVTPGAVTSLRFYGDRWMEPDDMAARNVQAFILHEAFHFWNGSLVSVAQGTPTWLHEGGADYAALLAGFRTGILSEQEVRERLGQALQRCRAALQRAGDRAIAGIAFLDNQVRYPCGTIIQWAADLHIRRASGGQRTAMHAWAETIRTARARPVHEYGLGDFYRAAQIQSGASLEPAALLVDRSGPERWDLLAPALNRLGSEVGQEATGEGRRATLLFHLLNQNCRALPEGTNIGFFTEGTTIRLDSPAGCGALAGNPTLQSIEGGDPFALTAATYQAVQAKCAASAAVTIVAADGQTLAAACQAPLAPAPQAYVVTRWLAPPR